MARNIKEDGNVAVNRPSEHNAQMHSRRALLAGGVVASSALVSAAVATGINRFFGRPPQINMRFDLNLKDLGAQVNTEVREKASLQIFRDFVEGYVQTGSDYTFWSGLDNFINTAPTDELHKYIEGDIAGPDGALNVWWPKDIQVNREAKPTVQLELFYGRDGDSLTSLTRFNTRLTPEGKVNNVREAPFPPDKILTNPEEMKGLLARVFNINDLKNQEGWETNYDGAHVTVSKAIQINDAIITTTINETGYTFLSIRTSTPIRVPSPKPGKVA